MTAEPIVAVSFARSAAGTVPAESSATHPMCGSVAPVEACESEKLIFEQGSGSG